VSRSFNFNYVSGLVWVPIKKRLVDIDNFGLLTHLLAVIRSVSARVFLLLSISPMNETHMHFLYTLQFNKSYIVHDVVKCELQREGHELYIAMQK
jgi:hypothetical protein